MPTNDPKNPRLVPAYQQDGWNIMRQNVAESRQQIGRANTPTPPSPSSPTPPAGAPKTPAKK